VLKRIFEVLTDLLNYLKGSTEVEYKYDQATATISKKVDVPNLAKGKKAGLVSVDVTIATAPTTSESFTITLNSHLGAKYNVVLFSNNPSLTSATSIVNFWDTPYPLFDGDDLTVAFANTEAKSVGIRIVLRVKG